MRQIIILIKYMDKNISAVKLRGTLEVEDACNQISDFICELLSKKPNIVELKHNTHNILYILELIENGIKQRMAKNIDKKKLCLDILKRMFNLTEAEQKLASSFIEVALENKLVKKVSSYKKVKKIAKGFFFKS